MKKSTKLITTAIALALVVAAMVVGIYAATSASAGITANVSWTATAGLEFHVGAWTYGAKESGTGEDSGTQQKNKVSVDTTTSNQAATNMGFALNTTFEDTSDDGVNNPNAIYYYYEVYNPSSVRINCEVKSAPTSTSQVKVEWSVATNEGNSEYDDNDCPHRCSSDTFDSTAPTTNDLIGSGGSWMICMKLTVLTPDQNVSNFNASISFEFSVGSEE